MKRKILPYNPKLKERAKELRKQGILSEVLLWKQIKNKSFGVEFHRQVPIDNYIVDFYCHELQIAIEIDGTSHQFDEIAVKDDTRQNKLESLGLRFIRFNDNDVKKQMSMVLQALENKIQELQDSKQNLSQNTTSPVPKRNRPLQRGNSQPM